MPLAGTSAVTELWAKVKSLVSTTAAKYLPLSGGTLTGPIKVARTGGTWVAAMTATTSSLLADFTTAQTQNGSRFDPYLRGKNTDGDVWVFGGGASNQIGFWGYDADRTANGTDWGVVANVSTGAVTTSGTASIAATTAKSFAAAQKVALTGDVTGSTSSTAGWSVATTLASSGVTAGSYGPSANATLAHSGTFTVPYLTVDAKGRVTAASTKTYTLPADNNTTYSAATTSAAGLMSASDKSKLDAVTASADAVSYTAALTSGTKVGTITINGSDTVMYAPSNTDTKVTNTLATTTKAYVTGTTSASTNTGTQVFDTGVYLGTTAGTLVATTFSGALSGNATSATKLATARTIRTNLARTSTASFNGTANVTPGVTGTLAVSNGGTGATTAAAALAALGAQAQHKTASVTLAAGATSWTASVEGVTADNTVVVSPATGSSDNYVKAGIVCSAQAAGSLSFTATTAPSADVVVNVVMLD